MTEAKASGDGAGGVQPEPAGSRDGPGLLSPPSPGTTWIALAGSFDPEIAYEDAVLGRRTVGAGRMRATYAAIFGRRS